MKNLKLLFVLALVISTVSTSIAGKIGGNVTRFGVDTGVDIDLLLGSGLLRWNDGTSQLQSSNDGVIFTDIGSTTITDPVEFNSVSNPGAEVDTAGWSAYADAAATTPVDGTGGAPTTTLTRITSSQLRGIGSFRLTKDAANRQGEGGSIDFTIDGVDLSRELEIIFEHKEDANYADDDIQVFIFNVDTPGFIPTNQQNLKDGVTEFRAKFTADAVDTNYRLIFHIASVNVTAYTLDFDNVRVRPVVLNTATTPDIAGVSLFSFRLDWQGTGVPIVGSDPSLSVLSLVDTATGHVTINFDTDIVGTNEKFCTCTTIENSSFTCTQVTTGVVTTVIAYRIFMSDTAVLTDPDSAGEGIIVRCDTSK